MFVRGLQEILKTIYLLVVSLGCLQNHEGKTVLLKALVTSDRRLEDLTFNPSS